MLFKKPEKIENIDASSISPDLYLKVDSTGKIIGGTGGGGGGSSYPLVNTFADLPTASEHTGEIYFVKQTTGVWVLGTEKKSGHYYSNGSTWEFSPNYDRTSIQIGSDIVADKIVSLTSSNGITLAPDVNNNQITISAPSALSNLSGTNTGDETASDIKTKLETLTLTDRLNATAVQGLPSKFTDLTNDYITLRGYGVTNSITANTWTQVSNVAYVDGDAGYWDATNQKFVNLPDGTHYMQIDIISGPTASNVNQTTQGRYYDNGGSWAGTQPMPLTRGFIIHTETIPTINGGRELSPYLNTPLTGTVGVRITLRRTK